MLHIHKIEGREIGRLTQNYVTTAVKHFPQILHYLSYIDRVQQPQFPLANCFHKHLSVCKHMLLCNTRQLIYLFKGG